MASSAQLRFLTAQGQETWMREKRKKNSESTRRFYVMSMMKNYFRTWFHYFGVCIISVFDNDIRKT